MSCDDLVWHTETVEGRRLYVYLAAAASSTGVRHPALCSSPSDTRTSKGSLCVVMVTGYEIMLGQERRECLACRGLHHASNG